MKSKVTEKLKDEILNIKGLAKNLKCSESMVRKMIRTGLPHMKLGNEYRFYLRKVTDYLETK